MYCNKPSKYVSAPTNTTEGYTQLYNLADLTNVGSSVARVDKLGVGNESKSINLPTLITLGEGYYTYYGRGMTGKNGYYRIDTNRYGYTFYYSVNTSFSSNSNVRLCYRPIKQEE